MSGFEHYPRELTDLDKEIRHYAAVCGIDPTDTRELDRIFHDHDAKGPHETLRGLLILRVKVETEMLRDGMVPPHSAVPLPEDQ